MSRSPPLFPAPPTAPGPPFQPAFPLYTTVLGRTNASRVSWANNSRQARVQLRLALWLGTAVSCFPLAVYAGPHIAPYLRSQEQNTDHDVEMLAVDHRIDMMLALGQLDENFERVSNDDKERQHDLMRRYAEVCEREGRPRPELPVYTSPVGEDSELVAAVKGDNKA